MSYFTQSHPGRRILEQYLKPQSLSVARTAKILGVSRQTLNNVVNGHASISPEMAVRLEKVFGEAAESWLRHRAEYDVAKVRARVLSEIKNKSKKNIL